MLRVLLRIVVWSGIALAVLIALAGIAVWRELTQDLPRVAELLDYRPPTATRVYAADGTPIGEFYVERRYLIAISDVPEHVRLAFVAGEDAAFYTHRGVNPLSIARAMYANWQEGEIVQGASTITQQVVKQLLLSPERSFERKVKELILAIELESKLTKDEILYLYLNHIYFGAGTYGISAAAGKFFDKTVAELSLGQAAMLAGLPQAPSRYNPFRRPESAKRRQRYVLDRMVAAGFISDEERTIALEEPLEFGRKRPPSYDAAPWYVEHVRTLLEEEFGPSFADLGLRVYTAVDLRMQHEAEVALHGTLDDIGRRLGDKKDGRHIEGALVAIDPDNGQVKALVGGLDFQRSQFNRAVQARRQPGSAFKPLLYAAAVDHGYTPSTVVLDAPISLPDGRRGYWTPKNFKNQYMGSVPLRTALQKSLNTVSVRLAVDLGIDPLREYLRLFGFPLEFPRHYAIALGSSEVTLLDLVRAYGVFVTGGRRFDPVFITSVTDTHGDPVEFPGTRPRFEPVMKPKTAYYVQDMLRSVVEGGTAREAKKLGRPAAGKTGTTNDSKDAWFIGFTPEMLTGVWIGYDADKTLGSYTGGRAATPIWTQFMQHALEGREVRDFTKPEDVTVASLGDDSPSAREEAAKAGAQASTESKAPAAQAAPSRASDGGPPPHGVSPPATSPSTVRFRPLAAPPSAPAPEEDAELPESPR